MHPDMALRGAPMPTTLLASEERAAELKQLAGDWLSHDLTTDQVDHLELLLRGLLAPADGYPPGRPLAVGAELAGRAATGEPIALRDPEGVVLAALTPSSIQSDAIAGRVEGLELPLRYDHRELREDLDAAGGLAIFTSVPLHRSGIEAARQAAVVTGIPPTVFLMVGGRTEPFALVRLLKAALPHLPDGTKLRLLPVAPGDAETRAAVEANANAAAVIEIDPGTPDDTFPEIAALLAEVDPPRSARGLTVFFTGLSGSGKSTIANLLRVRLNERGGRTISLLDGDLVRKNLSSELTFSKEHRNLNIQRIGYVASEITKHGGLAICAPIAPYDAVRKQVRETVSAHGDFILIHVATPLEACEARDRKGLYAMARAGKIKEFTGISDPYEVPGDAELVVQTTGCTPDEACDEVLAYLERGGWI